jgi:hypothetical protein
MHNDGVGLVHENGSVTWKPATRAMLRNFPVTRDPSLKSTFVKEKNQTGWLFRFLQFNIVIGVTREVARFVSALRARRASPFSRQ